MGLTCHCTGCSASARRGVRRSAMCRLGVRDSHACTPLSEFFEEGDRGISSRRPAAPTSATRRSFGGRRASVRFAACHVPQGRVAHGWACGSVRRAAAGVRVVESAHSGTATGGETASAPNGSDTGRTRTPDGDPIPPRSRPSAGPPLPAAAADESAHEGASETTNYNNLEKTI